MQKRAVQRFREPRLADRSGSQIQKAADGLRLRRDIPQQRLDDRAGAGLHAGGRTRIPRAAHGARRAGRKGGPLDPLLDGRQFELLHGDRQVPRRADVVGQYRGAVRALMRVCRQNVRACRDLAVEHDRLRPLRQHVARHDRSDERGDCRRSLDRGAAVRRGLREADRLLGPHRA